MKDSNPFMECSSLLEGFSLSINRDGVTGSTLSGNKVKAYVVVNFLSQVIFIFLLFLGMVIYANEVETKEK